jgi:hypothetical protein
MKYVVEAAGSSLHEFLFRLVERLDLARQGFLGRRRQYNTTALACHYKLAAIVHVELIEDIGRKRDGQSAAAHRCLGHVVFLFLSTIASGTNQTDGFPDFL